MTAPFSSFEKCQALGKRIEACLSNLPHEFKLGKADSIHPGPPVHFTARLQYLWWLFFMFCGAQKTQGRIQVKAKEYHEELKSGEAGEGSRIWSVALAVHVFSKNCLRRKRLFFREQAVRPRRDQGETRKIERRRPDHR